MRLRAEQVALASGTPTGKAARLARSSAELEAMALAEQGESMLLELKVPPTQATARVSSAGRKQSPAQQQQVLSHKYDSDSDETGNEEEADAAAPLNASELLRETERLRRQLLLRNGYSSGAGFVQVNSPAQRSPDQRSQPDSKRDPALVLNPSSLRYLANNYSISRD